MTEKYLLEVKNLKQYFPVRVGTFKTVPLQPPEGGT